MDEERVYYRLTIGVDTFDEPYHLTESECTSLLNKYTKDGYVGVRLTEI